MEKIDQNILGAFRIAIRAAIEAMGKSAFERSSFFAKGKAVGVDWDQKAA